MDSFSEEDEEITHFKLSAEERKQKQINEQEEFMKKSGEELITHYIEDGRMKKSGSKLRNLFQYKKAKVKEEVVLNDTFELTTFVGSHQTFMNKTKKQDYIGIE